MNGQYSYITTIDSVLSNIQETGIRILYLESDYPNILDKLIAGSVKLRDWLGLKKEKSFQEAKDNRECRKLTAVYKSIASGIGVLVDDKVDDQGPIFLKRDTTYYYQIPGKKQWVKFTISDHQESKCSKSFDVTPQRDIRVLSAGESKLDLSLQESFNPPEMKKVKFFYLTDPDTLATNTVAEMLQAFCDSEDLYPGAKLILTGTCCHIPDGFSSRIQPIRLGAPTQDDIKLLLREKLRKEKDNDFTEDKLNSFAQVLKGLSYPQIEAVFSKFGEGHIVRELKTRGSLEKAVWEQKQLENEKDSTLKISRIEENPGIVGVDGFLGWLEERLPDLADPEKAKKQGFKPPRGVILSGVPGTGKSQLSKQMAYRWGEYSGQNVSWIEFDIGRLSASEYGKSEERLEHFLARIGEQAPAVLFMDEVEKVFYQDSETRSMHEVKRQQMARFLGWLQEHRENVFTFMTSNDISILPPELIRSGRLSERFFVFMPSYRELMSILYSKLKGKAQFFSDDFRKEIEAKCGAENRLERYYNNNQNQKSPLDSVLTELAKEAIKTKRTPFMTGSDMETLVESTMLRLRKNGKDMKQCNAKVFANTMKEICKDPNFKPYGQSNLESLAKLYLSCDYRDVSDNPLLPRHQFNSETGKFQGGEYIDGTNPDNDYDQYMQRKLREVIEKQASNKKAEEEEKTNRQEYTKFQKNQIPFQEEQVKFQKEQMVFQREQMKEQRADRDAQKAHEQNARQLTQLQLEEYRKKKR